MCDLTVFKNTGRVRLDEDTQSWLTQRNMS